MDVGSFLTDHGKFLQDPENLKEIANQIIDSGNYFTIYGSNSPDPYMRRYYYMNMRPFAHVVIHEIIRSDDDGFHDHPWPWQTFVIKGGYWEHTQEGRFWRGPGYFSHRTEDDLHWIEIDPDVGPAWTLFLMGPRTKDWNFLVGETLIPHLEYFKMREQYSPEEIAKLVT